MIFSGHDAYITPAFYASKAQHGKVVPTWNYVAVHAYGTLRFVSDPAALRGISRRSPRVTRRRASGRGR